MAAARAYKQKDLKLLWGFAAGRCAFPACQLVLLAEETDADDAAVVGEIAHIVAHSDDGPRADKLMSDQDRDKYDNLLLLCGHHHTLVDKQANTYTIDDLRGWKDRHESWIHEQLTVEMSHLHFAELEVICRYLVDSSSIGVASTPMVAVGVADKMAANSLTDRVSTLLRLGLMQAPQVHEYLATITSKLDPNFASRLRAGFLQRYDVHRAAGTVGDALFLQLVADASVAGPQASDRAVSFQYDAAALAVLSHLFEICEIFEAP